MKRFLLCVCVAICLSLFVPNLAQADDTPGEVVTRIDEQKHVFAFLHS